MAARSLIIALYLLHFSSLAADHLLCDASGFFYVSERRFNHCCSDNHCDALKVLPIFCTCCACVVWV